MSFDTKAKLLKSNTNIPASNLGGQKINAKPGQTILISYHVKSGSLKNSPDTWGSNNISSHGCKSGDTDNIIYTLKPNDGATGTGINCNGDAVFSYWNVYLLENEPSSNVASVKGTATDTLSASDVSAINKLVSTHLPNGYEVVNAPQFNKLHYGDANVVLDIVPNGFPTNYFKGAGK